MPEQKIGMHAKCEDIFLLLNGVYLSLGNWDWFKCVCRTALHPSKLGCLRDEQIMVFDQDAHPVNGR